MVLVEYLCYTAENASKTCTRGVMRYIFILYFNFSELFRFRMCDTSLVFMVKVWVDGFVAG